MCLAKEPVAPSDGQVVRLLPLLAEAARATDETAARFVSPRPGILEEASDPGAISLFMAGEVSENQRSFAA